MAQPQLPRVQALAPDQRAVARLERGVIAAVYRVAQQRMPDRAEVHTNLMRASGFQLAAQQRKGCPIGSSPRERLPVRHGLP